MRRVVFHCCLLVSLPGLAVRAQQANDGQRIIMPQIATVEMDRTPMRSGLDIPPPPPAIVSEGQLPKHGMPPVPVGTSNVPQPDTPPSFAVNPGGGPGAPCDIALHTNSQVVTPGQSRSQIGEPSIAVRGTTGTTTCFMTGNWYAARSTDSGATWTHVPPTIFASVDGGFCCDQRTIYDPSRDITIWFLQYLYSGTTQRGSVRIAVSVGANLNAGANGTWHSWLWSPQDFGRPNGEWFDFPDIALSDNHLYCTSNVFNASSQYQDSIAIKMSLDTLRSGGSLTAWFARRVGGLGGGGSWRFTQGARETMYMGSHNSTASMRLYRNPDLPSNAGWASTDTSIASWNDGPRVALAPNGVNWLGRIDGRITGGYQNSDEYGFLWTSNANGGQTRPHVRIARFRRTDHSNIGTTLIWNNSLGFAYPAAVTNLAGQYCVTLAIGDATGAGTLHPGTASQIFDDCYNGSWPVWASGLTSPNDPSWGDYYSVQRHPVRTMKFASSGMAMLTAFVKVQVPRYAYFGRERDNTGWVSVGISSVPVSGINIACSSDNLGRTSVTTQGYASYNASTSYVLTAPNGATVGGVNYAFCNWRASTVPYGPLIDQPAGQRTLGLGTGTQDDRAEAVYTPARRVDVGSRNPASGISIAVNRADVLGAASGSTAFSRWYKPGSGNVTFTAPTANGIHPFNRWYLNGVAQASGVNSLTVDITTSTATIAVEAEYCTHTHGSSRQFGAGCLGSNGNTPNHFTTSHGDAQSTVRFEVSGAPANSSAALFVGFSDTLWGNIPLPLNLSLIGAGPTCNLNVELVASFGFATDGSGSGFKDLYLRSTTPLGLKIYTQTVHIDFGVPAPLKIIVSNGLEVTTGGNVCN